MIHHRKALDLENTDFEYCYDRHAQVKLYHPGSQGILYVDIIFYARRSRVSRAEQIKKGELDRAEQ